MSANCRKQYTRRFCGFWRSKLAGAIAVEQRDDRALKRKRLSIGQARYDDALGSRSAASESLNKPAMPEWIQVRRACPTPSCGSFGLCHVNVHSPSAALADVAHDVVDTNLIEIRR
jgi:hypothetical protein